MIEVKLGNKMYPARFTVRANAEISKRFADGEKLSDGDSTIDGSLFICAIGLKYGALKMGKKVLSIKEYMEMADENPRAFKQITSEFMAFSRLLNDPEKNGKSPTPEKEIA